MTLIDREAGEPPQGLGLELIGVHVAIGTQVLVPSLDLHLRPGEVVALTGPSGCGKSSLLHWLAGVGQPPLHGRGRVRLDGVDLSAEPAERRRIGLMLQDDALFPHLSVAENLLFALPAATRPPRAWLGLGARGREADPPIETFRDHS